MGHTSGDDTVGRKVGLAARRVVVTIAGAAVLLAGVAMMVLPGPGILTIIAGLAILSTEYTWAKRLYRSARARWKVAYDSARSRARARRGATDLPAAVDEPGPQADHEAATADEVRPDADATARDVVIDPDPTPPAGSARVDVPSR